MKLSILHIQPHVFFGRPYILLLLVYCYSEENKREFSLFMGRWVFVFGPPNCGISRTIYMIWHFLIL